MAKKIKTETPKINGENVTAMEAVKQFLAEKNFDFVIIFDDGVNVNIQTANGQKLYRSLGLIESSRNHLESLSRKLWGH